MQTLIMRRDTHIDSLMERLKEARVQRIVEPMILGENAGFSSLDDDYQYVLDLGLLRYTTRQFSAGQSHLCRGHYSYPQFPSPDGNRWAGLY